MKKRKLIASFLVLICILTAFCLSTLGVSAAEGTRTVYATTSTSVKQGSYGYLYVYLDDLTDLSALNVSVYYDKAKITVQSAYNQVASVVNDISTGDGCVNASYIFDGKGTANKTNLFYISYQVNSASEIGDTYFDIVVNEAYTPSLEAINFTGSRCAFEIAEQSISQSCSISSTSSVSTSVGEEFELSYRFNTYQIASGSMNIQYDPECFEVVSVTSGGFLAGKISDVNTALDGSVSISFVGTDYQYTYDIVTVRFKTLKNVTEASDIKLIVSELYDKELNRYSCNGYTTKANIVFDETYTEDAPSMSISASYNAETGKVTATIKLEKNSMLGAGDFVFKFDTKHLTFNSAQKGFSPSFFNINDKDAANGILKFSIISLSDITEEQIILTVVFDAKHSCQDKTADFEISGSGLTDSLVNTIQLNFVDSSVIIPLKHTAAAAVEENRVEPTCTATGSYDSVVYCSVCGNEVSREAKTIDMLGHDHATEWTVDVEPTCTTVGSKSHHCSRCTDKANVTEIPALGHTWGDWYETKAPTCTATGADERECSVCHTKETRTTNANGHTNATAVVENKVNATCTADGSYDSVVYCSVCSTELSREAKVIDKLGHNHSTDWTVDVEPTCTTVGSKSHHCSRCTDKADVTEIPALGHTWGDWYETKAPTCTATGTDERECSVCHTKETRTTNANGHTNATAVVENKVNATCTADGSYDSVVYCSVCSTELSREAKVIDKLGHNHSTDWTVDIEPTCTTVGSKSHHCSRCDDKADVTEIPANGHNNAKAVVENKIDATCTVGGSYDSVVYCSVCSVELGREAKTIDALGHDYNDEWTVDIQPTCTSVGSKSHHCSRCSAKADVTEVDALAHTFGMWSTQDAKQHKRSCACGETELADHVFDNEADASCNDCGTTREIVTAPPVETPNNGDTNADTEKSGCGASVSSGVWLIMLLMGATMSVSFKKKKQ